MTIEDVRHLLRNSVQSSSSIFIDSAQRNREYHPTPSQYVVHFDEPMRYVFGMDVLDAAMAGTSYNVDADNNNLCVLGFDLTTGSALAPLGVEEDEPSRAAVAAITYELGFSHELNAWMGGGRSARVLVLSAAALAGAPPPGPPPPQDLSAVVEGATLPSDTWLMVRNVLTNVRMVRFEAPRGPQADTAQCASFETSSLLCQAASSAAGKPAFAVRHLNALYAVQEDGPHAEWLRAAMTNSYALVPSAAGSMPNEYSIVYYTAIRIDPATESDYASLATHVFSVWNVHLEVGNYTAVTLLQQLQQQLQALGLSAASTTTSTVTKQGKLRLTAGAGMRIVFPAHASTIAATLGFDLWPKPEQLASQPVALRPHNACMFGAQPSAVFMSVLRPSSSQGGALAQDLDAPGLLNLLGRRYITLRCPEIEQHMGQTGKYGSFSPGIGVFRLANANEVVQLRFDYVSLIRKPFHPIGRLPRLTLRFENSDGSLYDFKGINHQLLLTIKYYTPQPKGGAPAFSALNPSYDPDHMRWLNEQHRDEARAQWGAPRGYDDSEDATSDGDSDGGSDGSDGSDGSGGSSGTGATGSEDGDRQDSGQVWGA